MKIGSLFSGIGGLELGLERAGVGHTVWQVEQDTWCRSVLAKHWPDAARYDDVRAVGSRNLEQVDVICGGFPCQDLSIAGRGAGLDGARSGLFWEMLRIARELRPRYVVLENVAAIRSRGADVVTHALAELGYDAVWGVVHASDVGAPHRRARWFCVAWLADADGSRRNGWPRSQPEARRRRQPEDGGAVAYAVCSGRQERDPAAEPIGAGLPAGGRDPLRGYGGAQPRLGGGVDGVPRGLDRWPAGPSETPHAWEPPRTTPRGATDRNRRLKALGNAVVPQVAEVIGHWLLTIEEVA